jgi:hypothetical protein
MGDSSRDHRHVISPAVHNITHIVLSVKSSVPLHKATSKQAAYS